jgi:hypothetical protein
VRGQPALPLGLPKELAQTAVEHGVTFSGAQGKSLTFADTSGERPTTFTVPSEATSAEFVSKLTETRGRVGETSRAEKAVFNLVRGTMAKHIETLKTLGHDRYPVIGTTDSPSGIQARAEDGKNVAVITVDPKKLAAVTAGLSERARSKYVQRAVDEEVLHVAALKWEKHAPENSTKLEGWGAEKDDLNKFLGDSYEGWSGLNDRQKGHEKLRAVLQKRWTGKLTEAAYQMMREFLKYLRGIYDKLTAGQRAMVDEVEAMIKGETKAALTETKPGKSETVKRQALAEFMPPKETIEGSYSGDKIPEGRIRKPVKLNDKLYIKTGSAGKGQDVTYEMAELIPAESFTGKKTTYRERVALDNGNVARADPRGFYYGIQVTSGGKKYVIGTEIHIKPKEAYATKTGKESGSSQPEHTGVPRGKDVRSDEKEVRKKDSGQAGSSGGAIERTPAPEEKQPRAGQSEKKSVLDADTQKAVRDAFEGLFAATPKERAIASSLRKGASIESAAKTFGVKPDQVEKAYDRTLAERPAYTWRGLPSGNTAPGRTAALQEYLDKKVEQRGTTIADLAEKKPDVLTDMVEGWERKYLAAGVPKLRRGEKQGDIFSGQTEELTLTGESGVDWGERQRQAELAEQERIKAQLKQDDEQGTLFAAPPQLALPAEKLAQFIVLAQKLLEAGVDTPEKLVTELKAIFPDNIDKVRPYSQNLWDAIGMVRPDLRGTHDWPKLYGDEPKARKTRASAPDGGFTDHPLITAIMGDFGGLMSKSAAIAKMGKEWFEKNKSLWDGAPKLADPRHTKIYDPRSGQAPDAVAQGLADIGMLRDGDVEELWRQIAAISDSSKRIERQEREQNRAAAEAEKQPFEEPEIEDPFDIGHDFETGDKVRITVNTLEGPKERPGFVDFLRPDGTIEVRDQMGGIHKLQPSEVLPWESKSDKLTGDDTGGRDDLEPDSGLAGAGEQGGEDSVPSGSGTTRTPGTLLDDPAGGSENAATSGPLSADVPAAPHRAQSDLLLPESAPAVPERAPGSPEPEGSSQPRDSGLPADTNRTKLAGEDLVVSPVSQGVGAGSESGGTELDAIRRAAPALTPEQAEDVRFIEARLHEMKKPGVLLTNGTGTGKTFSGMGEVKMMLDRGAKHVLVVVPSDKIGSDWVDTAHRFFGVKDAAQLPSTFDNGSDRRMVVTTYANFGQNNTLVKRPWDLVVTDESHYLSSSEGGDTTLALEALRALTWHPQGLYRRTQMLDPEAHDGLRTLRMYERRFKRLTATQEEQRRKFTERLDAIEKEVRKELTAKTEATRPKVLFMSATPFAYRKASITATATCSIIRQRTPAGLTTRRARLVSS